MTNYEIIEVQTAAGLLVIPETISDLFIVINREDAIINGNIPLPQNPVDTQSFMVSSKCDINTLTLNTFGKTIIGGITSLRAGVAVEWTYKLSADAWFVSSSPIGETSIRARVTGSNATTTGQVLTNITGLVIPLVANALYEFEAVLSVQTSAVTTGTAYGVNFSAAGAQVEAIITGSSTSTATKTLRINVFNLPTALYLATSNQTGGILIKGTIITGANPGDLSIQHLKLTSGTSTVFIGSPLKVTRIN